MKLTNGHALVIGSGLAGLLAARVLSERYARVTMIDRDTLPTAPDARKGVPQGRHVHVLLKTGADILEQLFPGLWREMRQAGSVRIDFSADMAWFHYGVWKSRMPAGIDMHCQSQPFLEWHVRRRVMAKPGVTLLAGKIVEGLVHDSQRGRVVGALIRARGARCNQIRPLGADLVVDASGRGTRVPRWLSEMGYARPNQDVVPTDIVYASRSVRLPPEQKRDWRCLVIAPRAPEQTRAGYIFPYEDGTHLVTLVGYCGDTPPLDEEGYRAYARSLPHSELWDTMRDAQPLGPVRRHRLPSNRWHRYDRMNRFPDGLVVMGDAVCSFNPLFGQGMTTAAIDARVLADRLSDDNRLGLPDASVFARTGSSLGFQKRLVAGKKQAWTMATTEDLRYPQVAGKRPFGLPVLNWYKSRFLEFADDPTLHRAFLQVLTFQRGLDAILAPRVVARVMRHTAFKSLRGVWRRRGLLQGVFQSVSQPPR